MRRSGFLIFSACVGNLLEWYDFAVYALFAPYIAASIFRATDDFSRLAQSLLVFGLGAVARPLGALLIGLYADRRGRGPALLLTCLLMGAGTGMIVLDPPYAAAGRMSIVILCAARILQGLSAGGEIGGAAAFLAEQARPGRRGLSASFLQATMGLSNMLGAAVAATLTTFLDHDQMAHWGWRVPFCIGLAIVPVGLVLRRAAPAAPPVSIARQDRAHHHGLAVLRALAGRHRGALAAAFGLSVLWAAAPYALVIFFPLYAQTALGASPHASYVAYLLGNVALVLGALAAGRLADRLGARRVLVAGAILLAVLPAAMMGVLGHRHDPATMAAVAAGLCGLVALFVGAAPLGIAGLFPAPVRATGIALSYNAATSVFGGFAPAVLAALGTGIHGIAAPALYVAAAAIPALLGLAAPAFAGAGLEIPMGHAAESIPAHTPGDERMAMTTQRRHGA